MKAFGDVKRNPVLKIVDYNLKDTLCGDVTLKGVRCSFVATWNDEHVSIAPYNGSIPTWEMMCKLKDIFFDEEEEAYQIHPKKSEYVNIKNNCLHLWGKI